MSAKDTEIEQDRPVDEPKSKKQKYRKDKPWDTEDIDKWALPPLEPKDHPHPFAEESSFACLFPKYRENYLREVWPHITKKLEEYSIGCELNLIEGSMTVKTTRKTWDPYAIIKARDLLKLLARSVPWQQASRIMEPDMNCDIVKIGNVVRNKDRFIKRRQRLIGPNGNTLKALELLTGCYILVQGNTVSAMGTFQGLKQIRRIILDCMKNIHPIYHIKELMIKRELMKDPTLKNENWSRFLPQFKKTQSKIQKVRTEERGQLQDEQREFRQQQQQQKKKAKKEYTPFPPAQTPRKVDMEIETGEFFLSKEQKVIREREKKSHQQQEKTRKRIEEREKPFIAPAEPKIKNRTADSNGGSSDSIDALKQRIIAKAKKQKETRANIATKNNQSNHNASDYVMK